MIVGIHHTALSTRDADRLVRFYRDLFGFEVEFDFPWEREGLWEEGPITIGLDIRPAPATISITCSHRTGP